MHEHKRRVRERRDPGVQLRVVRVALGARRFVQVLGRLAEERDLVDDGLIFGQDLLVPLPEEVDGRVAGEEPVRNFCVNPRAIDVYPCRQLDRRLSSTLDKTGRPGRTAPLSRRPRVPARRACACRGLGTRP
jgi:hypothetical protein